MKSQMPRVGSIVHNMTPFSTLLAVEAQARWDTMVAPVERKSIRAIEILLFSPAQITLRLINLLFMMYCRAECSLAA